MSQPVHRAGLDHARCYNAATTLWSMDVVAAVRQIGGIARTRELRHRGCTPASIASAVAAGSVLRLRVGWFALPTLPDPVIRAHRVGGRPACATVAALRGLWMLEQPLLHIEVARDHHGFRPQMTTGRATGARNRGDLVVHWVRSEPHSSRLGQDITTALAQVAACLPVEAAVCTIDSAAHAGLTTLPQLRAIAGPAGRLTLARCDASAESGVESLFRLRALDAGFAFRCQVSLPGGRVDFLFGDRLIVEVDGAEHHAGYEAFVSDRERDAYHHALGYLIVRLTYAQVVRRWHEVESVLRLIHSRGDQFWPARIRKSARRSG